MWNLSNETSIKCCDVKYGTINSTLTVPANSRIAGLKIYFDNPTYLSKWQL